MIQSQADGYKGQGSNLLHPDAAPSSPPPLCFVPFQRVLLLGSLNSVFMLSVTTDQSAVTKSWSHSDDDVSATRDMPLGVW